MGNKLSKGTKNLHSSQPRVTIDGESERNQAQGLPYDVLSTILFYTTPDISLVNGPGLSILSRHPLISASHVCSDWRTAILNTPLLWATVPILVPGFSPNHPDSDYWPRKMAKLVTALRVWMARSAGLPLSFHVSCFVTLTSDQAPQHIMWSKDLKRVSRLLNEVVDILRNEARRWRHAIVFLRVDQHTAPLFRLLDFKAEELPVLESANLTVFTHGFSHNTTANSAFGLTFIDRVVKGGLFTSKSLRSLSIHGELSSVEMGNYLDSTDGQPRWSTLTRLDIGRLGHPFSRVNLSHSRAVKLLRAVPSLVHCSFLLSDQSRPITDFNHPTTLPNLVSLKLAGTPVVQGFAAAFDFPSLQRVELLSNIWIYKREAGKFQGIQELLKKVGKQLTNLDIPLLSAPVLDETFLDDLQRLRTLKLGLDVPTLRSLAILPSDDGSHPPRVFCPTLQELHVNLHTTNIMHYDPAPAEKDLIALLASRSVASAREDVARVSTLRVNLQEASRRKGFVGQLEKAGLYPDCIEVYFTRLIL